MLLDALMIAAGDDDCVGVCFVASARNALPLLHADNERDIWADVVARIEAKVDIRAEAEWTNSALITVAPMPYDPPKIGTPFQRPIWHKPLMLGGRMA